MLTPCSFGHNERLLVVFYQLLADRFKEGDYNGLAVSDLLEVDLSIIFKRRLTYISLAYNKMYDHRSTAA